LVPILLAVVGVAYRRWSPSTRWKPAHAAAPITGALPAHPPPTTPGRILSRGFTILTSNWPDIGSLRTRSPTPWPWQTKRPASGVHTELPEFAAAAH